jgi:hypothetical protein
VDADPLKPGNMPIDGSRQVIEGYPGLDIKPLDANFHDANVASQWAGGKPSEVLGVQFIDHDQFLASAFAGKMQLLGTRALQQQLLESQAFAARFRTKAERFDNLRSQVWWRMREDLRLDRVALPEDEELWQDLTTPTYTTRNGKICVEPKETIIKRLRRSPNKGDAAAYGGFVRGRAWIDRTKAKDDVVVESRNVDRGLERHLAARRFFVAERYTIADIALYAYTHVADEGGFELGPYPAVQAWIERVREQPRHVPISQG